MNLRPILLRIALASLGLAAVVGASAILVADDEVVWRIVGTAITTAIATGLLFGTSILMDKPKTRASGLFGTLLIVAMYLLVVASIWELQEAFFPNVDNDWQMPFTALMLFVVGAPAMAFVRWAQIPQARLASIVALAACALVFTLFEVAIWQDSGIWEEFAESASVTSLYGAAAFALLIVAGPGFWRWVRYAGVAFGTCAWAMAVYAIWWHVREGSLLFTALSCAAAVIAYINLTLLPALVGWQRWVRFAAIAAALVAGGAAFVADAMVVRGSDDQVLRLAGSASFIAGCCALALLIFWRLNRRIAQLPVISQINQLTLICPGCNTKQTVSTGASQCPTCNLRFEVQIHEPRCPQCDYLLYMLKSDRCPECGTPVGVNQTHCP